MFDPIALEEAFDKAARGHMMKIVREWIIYTAPPEVLEIYHEYERITQRDEIKIDE